MVQCSKCDSYIVCPRVSVDSDDSEKMFERLRSPAEATEAEKARANQILQDAESDFASYDAEIARLKTALSVLEHKRQCLQDYVDKHRSLLAPVRRLPPEILGLIFLAHISQSGNKLVYEDLHCQSCESSYGVIPCSELSSFVLSQVSIGWRRVASSLPRLWTELEMLFIHSLDIRERGHLEYVLSIFLERSVQVSLTMIIDLDGNGDSVFTDLAIRKIFQPVYCRCRSLTLTRCSLKLFDIRYASNSITDFPYLEYLRIPEGGLMESAVLPAIYQAPRLRHLEIFRPPGYFGSGSFSVSQQFPWVQITTLNLSNLHVASLWTYLGRCVHLSKLTVHKPESWVDYGDDLDFVGEQELVTLPHLISIDIQLRGPSHGNLTYVLTLLYSKLTAPALKHLTVAVEMFYSNESIRTTWPLSVFDSFAARSADRGSGLFELSSLRVKYPTTTSSLLSLLDRLPCLTELEIIEPEHRWGSSVISDEFLYGLFIGTNTIPFGEKPRIPRLLHLCLNVGWYRQPTFKTEILNEMVKSRWIPDPTCASTIGIACLRSIKVVGDKRTGEKALGYESLRELGRSGLKVEIVPKLV